MRATVPLLTLALVVFGVSAVAAAELGTRCGVTPAALGAGPGAQVSGLTGIDLDTTYMRAMYQQHADIAALASLMAARSGNREVRDLAGHIRSEQLDLNRKLAIWYAGYTGGQSLTANTDRSQAIMASLECPTNMSFTEASVSAMMELLAQSKQASDRAVLNAASPELKHQAGLVSKVADKEIRALQYWQRTGHTDPWSAYRRF